MYEKTVTIKDPKTGKDKELKLIVDPNVDDIYCPHCGTKNLLVSKIKVSSQRNRFTCEACGRKSTVSQIRKFNKKLTKDNNHITEVMVRFVLDKIYNKKTSC